MTTAREIMTVGADCVREDESVLVAAGRMTELGVDRPVDDPRVRRPDRSLARREFGWRPEVSSGDGLTRTIKWFADRLG